MGKYTKPAAQPRILGSKQGATFQRSGRVFSIRRKSHPVNKNTVKQSQQKNKFESMTSRWRTLSGADKYTWNTERVNYQRTNSLGNNYTLTGQQLQTSSNLNLATSQQPVINQIPPAPVLTGITLGVSIFELTLGTARLKLNPQIVPAGCTVRYDTTSYYTNSPSDVTRLEYRNVLTLTAGSDSDQNFYLPFITILGQWSNSVIQSITIRVQIIATDTGQVVNTLYRTTTVRL